MAFQFALMSNFECRTHYAIIDEIGMIYLVRRCCRGSTWTSQFELFSSEFHAVKSQNTEHLKRCKLNNPFYWRHDSQGSGTQSIRLLRVKQRQFCFTFNFLHQCVALVLALTRPVSTYQLNRFLRILVTGKCKCQDNVVCHVSSLALLWKEGITYMYSTYNMNNAVGKHNNGYYSCRCLSYSFLKPSVQYISLYSLLSHNLIANVILGKNWIYIKYCCGIHPIP